MDFNTYQRQTRSTAIYPGVGNNLWYPGLGLAGESGEVAEKIKKIYRDDNGVVTPEAEAKIRKELGDALWYIANICSELCIDLESVAIANVDKLQDRKDRGVLKGSGDNR
jgi:NTP pyrophosphatase (non-canonical NTP hydrolase)